MIKKSLIWKLDAAMAIVVLAGFEIIDLSISQLEGAPFYYDYLVTAKWLLIGGFTIHGLLSWFISRPR